MSKGICSVEDCDRPSVTRGWCQRHYLRWTRHGDPLAGGKSRLHDGKPWLRLCSVDDCEERVLARGWCNRHYTRWKNTGDPLGSLAKPRQTICGVDGCDRPFIARGFCALHYTRWKNHGSTDAPRVWWENAYEDLDLVTTRLTITNPEGDEFVILLDTADVPAARTYRWYVTPHGYTVTHIGTRADKHALPLHRLVLGLAPGDKRIGDHISGDRLDNRSDNLRIADAKLNAANQAIINELGSSKYRGVCWDKSRSLWKAYCRLDGRMRNLGYFATEEEAANVVYDFRAEHFLDSGYLRRHAHTPSTRTG